MSRQRTEAFLYQLFNAAVSRAQPSIVLPPYINSLSQPKGRTLVIGAGKASAAMAQVFEERWAGRLEGLVITAYGHAVATKQIEIVEAAHPIPDKAGVQATKRMLDMLKGLHLDDQVVCLISGGGSALLCYPAPGLTLADKQQINKALLASGANIEEMNTVRKELSEVKGGGLGMACFPAKLTTLMISDVPGDDPALIASGPTQPKSSTAKEAREILKHYQIKPSAPVLNHLQINQQIKKDDSYLKHQLSLIIASAKDSLESAAKLAKEQGYALYHLGDDLQRESRELAKDHAILALMISRGEHQIQPPCVLLSGGETTVNVKGQGRGGRNTEYLLALAIALKGDPKISAIACDTDGIDGTQDNAGALLINSLQQAKKLGLDPHSYLDNNDSYGFFKAINALVTTGPTLTNVNDFRAIVIDPY